MTYHPRGVTPGIIELKDAGEGDAADVVTKALADLTASVDERLKKLETKAEAKTEDKADAAPEAKALAGRLDKIEARLNRPNAGGGQPEDEAAAVEKKSFGVYLRRGDAALGETERKALTVANDASAGYLAPEAYGSEILRALVEYSPIRQYARVMQLAAPEVRLPKRLTGTNAQWVSEIGDRPESTMTFGQVTLTAHEIATYVEISKQLLEDAAYDVEGELRTALSEDFGQKESAAFVNGDGVGKPKGILAAATGIQEVVTGAAATLGSAPADLLIDVMSKLPTAYAQNGAWLLNRTVLASIRKLKDAQGAYLWQPSIQAGAPATLLGRPVIEAVDMPNVGAGAFPIVFGDWSGYRIIDRVGLSILVDPFTRATNGIVRFHARRRVGGDVLEPAKFVKVKVAAS